MTQDCPTCGSELTAAETGFHCDVCRQTFGRLALCPDCRRPLERLQACGAVNYFCQHGHGLISKKRVLFTAQPH
ncbi:hypothetical protein FJU30_23590 [Affinibrenneria salicis]|uniref:Primosomal protein N' (Replication factor Y)-superfamily II helicase n=1 Tax=Affinibrenneria salicis TaxID=2590031 RepID=A0A5J5FSP7_9GAMM|nr:zinc ribbon domain-containing protein [Affinibrenneria salicis]KAA8995736.1 hypothetical protein FJU30_23590 [Affinibrenneria salicis]